MLVTNQIPGSMTIARPVEMEITSLSSSSGHNLDLHTVLAQAQSQSHATIPPGASVYVPDAYRQNVRSAYTTPASGIQPIDQALGYISSASACSGGTAPSLLLQPPHWLVQPQSMAQPIHAPIQLRRRQTTRPTSTRPTYRYTTLHKSNSFPYPITFLLSHPQTHEPQTYSDNCGGIVSIESAVPENPYRFTLPSGLDLGGHFGGGTSVDHYIPWNSALTAQGGSTTVAWSSAQGLGQAWVADKTKHGRARGSHLDRQTARNAQRTTSQSEQIRQQRAQPCQQEQIQQSQSYRYRHTAPLPTLQQPQRYQPYPVRNACSTTPSTYIDPAPTNEAVFAVEQSEHTIPIENNGADETTLPEINFEMDAEVDLEYDIGELSGIDELLNRTIVPMNAAMHDNPNPLPAPIGAEIPRRLSESDTSENLVSRSLAPNSTRITSTDVDAARVSLAPKVRPRPQCGPILIGNLSPLPSHEQHPTSATMTVEVQPIETISEPEVNTSQSPFEGDDPAALPTKYNTFPVAKHRGRLSISSIHTAVKGWSDKWERTGRTEMSSLKACPRVNDESGEVSMVVSTKPPAERLVSDVVTFSRRRSPASPSTWIAGETIDLTMTPGRDVASQSPTELTGRMKYASLTTPPGQSEIVLRAMLHHLETWDGEPPMTPEETRAIKVMWRDNLDKRKWHTMYRVSHPILPSNGK